MAPKELTPEQLQQEKVLLEEAKSRNNIVPPNVVGRKFRTLVVCFDGTGDQEDNDVTNVIELRNMLHGWHKGKGNIDPELQMVYYKGGIGTAEPHIPGTKVPLPRAGVINYLSNVTDQAIAWSLETHVNDAYIWLAKNYRDGDKICIFGFSRGAYTSRVFAGMLSKVGLLPAHPDDKKMEELTGEAYKSYAAYGGVEAWENSIDFMDEHDCRQVPVEFLGCWDTVNSVGLVTATRLPYTSENPIVRTFRHAIALDEHRARFGMNMWGGTEDDDYIDVEKAKEQKKGFFSSVASSVTGLFSGPKEKPSRKKNLKELKPQFNFKTDEEEVWFAGAHCDIGGGSVPTATRPNLAHIPLRWMIRECFKKDTGMIFKEQMLRDNFGLEPTLLYPNTVKRPRALIPAHDARVQKAKVSGYVETAVSYVEAPVNYVSNWLSPVEAAKRTNIVMAPGIEESLDMQDALAPLYDQLELKPAKWIALEKHYQKQWSNSAGKFVRRQNNFRGRKIPLPVIPGSADDQKLQDPRLYKIRVHRTVKTRMETPMEDGSFYIPKALVGGKDGDTLDKFLHMVHWVDEDEDKPYEDPSKQYY